MGKKDAPDNVVSSIGDAVVRESDVKLLDGPHWLSDRIIGYYFEYLHQQIHEGSEKICFIRYLPLHDNRT